MPSFGSERWIRLRSIDTDDSRLALALTSAATPPTFRSPHPALER
jgi:hypothetical protein